MKMEKNGIFAIRNRKFRAAKAAALIAVMLMLSSFFFVFLSSAPVNAQATTSTIPSNLLQYEWVSPANSPTRSFFSAGPAPNMPSILWKATVPGAQMFPLAFNGMVFVQGAGGTYALNGATGQLIWKNNVSSFYMCKIDNTYMVIGSTCVRIDDGSKVWVGPPGFSYGQTVLAGAGYIPGLQMFVDSTYGWNLPDPSKPPTLAWNLTDITNVGAGVNVYGDGKVFILSNDLTLKAVEAQTGNVLWKVSTTSSSIYSPSYYNGMVIQGGLDNNMRAWDADTGKLLWTYNPHTWYGQWAASTGFAYGMVYEHNQDNYVYAINATTGELVWRQQGPGIGYSNILSIADGKVYVQMGENEYRDFNTGEYAYSEYNCYDAFTGQLIWTNPFENSPPFNSQCIAYGNLYVIPSKPSEQQSGVWTYPLFGAGSMNEVWCIGSQPADWPMFLSSPSRAGDGAGPTNLTLKWKFATNGAIVSSATCVNGIAYFGSSGTDYNIYAVDANTGVKKWNFTTESAIFSSVAVVDGKVYTGADDGNIYCINAATGKQVWKTSAGGITTNRLGGGFQQVRSSPIVFSGKVYVGSLDGYLYCLNANSGSVVWKFQGVAPSVILASPMIFDNAIYVASTRGGYPYGQGPLVTQGDFYKLDMNGNILWNKTIPYDLTHSPGSGNWLFATPTVAPDLGLVFLRNGFRMTYAINATTGDTVWSYDGRYNAGTPFQLGGTPLVDAVLYKYGRIYFNDYYGVVCLNATNAKELWFTYLSRENSMQGTTFSYGRIYTVTEAGVLYVLDATTGKKLSYYEFGNLQMHSSPVPYNGSLYVGASDWNLYCFGDARLVPAVSSEQSPSPTPTPSPTTSTEPTATPTPTATITPIPTSTATPTASSQPTATTTPTDSTTAYIIVAAVVAVIIVVIAVAAVFFRKRK
jgi:outer membrane protein assembly factor BamB